MRFEVPVCNRCCFCVPLRYGLITWGYVKLFIVTPLSIWLALFLLDVEPGSDLQEDEKPLKYSFDRHLYNVVFLLVGLLTVIADIALNITFIVGCQKKNIKLIKTYYLYSVLLLILLTGMCFVSVGQCFYNLHRYINCKTMNLYMLEFFNTAVLFANAVLQTYLTLLVRTEVIKLKNGCHFKFTNNSNEVQGTLDVEDARQNERNIVNLNMSESARVYALKYF